MALVQTPRGGPLTGYTVTVTDLPGSGPRTDVATSTASDGSFRAELTSFPASEPLRSPPHHELVRIESPTTVTIVRDVYLHAGQAVDLGLVVAGLRDSNVTTIGPTGGTATDSQSLVQVQIPSGALASATPIVITPHMSRSQVPFRLPDATVTTYAMTLEPEGTLFAQPVTVRVKNWLNLPTTTPIPVGYVDTLAGVWRNLGTATWDGSMFAFQTSHFSYVDVNYNAPNSVELITVSLPTHTGAGQPFDLTLSYDSQMTAGSVSGSASDAGAPSPQGYGAVAQSAVVSATRGTSITVSCVSRATADKAVSANPNSCIGGACSTGSGLTLSSVQVLSDWNGATTSQTIAVPSNGVDVQIVPSDELPLASNGSLPTPYFAPRHMELRSGVSGACVAGGGAFGNPGTSTTLVQTNQDLGPLATYDEEVFVHQTQGSTSGAGWGIAQVERLYKASSADLAVLVRGDGGQETFTPRAAVTGLATSGLSGNYALATDGTTGQVLLAKPGGEIDSVNPTTGATTSVVTGLSFPSNPLSMAITYISGVRHFVVALDTQLIDVNASTSAARVLATRTSTASETP